MDFFRSLAQKVTAATSQAMDWMTKRVETCKAGNVLLEDGGDTAMSIMIAKRTARDAISEEEGLLKNLTRTASKYEDAADKLSRAMQSPCPAGVTGSVDFQTSAQVYADRAAAMKEAALFLERGIPAAKASAPSASAIEEDAMMLAAVKGGEAKLMDEVHKGLGSAAEGIKKMSEVACQSCRGREAAIGGA
mmetsp:Transcript_89151/g.157974  ORF Transcript_89151/g.157974 Transcript_89151/m.157974 type:complete len:191 (-) Transcript_89151:211-783(-)